MAVTSTFLTLQTRTSTGISLITLTPSPPTPTGTPITLPTSSGQETEEPSLPVEVLTFTLTTVVTIVGTSVFSSLPTTPTANLRSVASSSSPSSTSLSDSSSLMGTIFSNDINSMSSQTARPAQGSFSRSLANNTSPTSTLTSKSESPSQPSSSVSRSDQHNLSQILPGTLIPTIVILLSGILYLLRRCWRKQNRQQQPRVEPLPYIAIHNGLHRGLGKGQQNGLQIMSAYVMASWNERKRPGVHQLRSMGQTQSNDVLVIGQGTGASEPADMVHDSALPEPTLNPSPEGTFPVTRADLERLQARVADIEAGRVDALPPPTYSSDCGR